MRVVCCFIIFGCCFRPVWVDAQQVSRLNLVREFKKNRFDTTEFRQPINVSGGNALTVKGILWLKDVTFKTGTIDIDLRGRDVFLQSFLGIAFHAKNKNKYDVVYFCPFRFDDGDTTRWYSVKYMSVPDYGYSKLRREYPRVYEHEPLPAPKPADWFHVTIRIHSDSIAVFVNHSPTPSLLVHALPTLTEGRVGLWSYAGSLPSDFANLEIRQEK